MTWKKPPPEGAVSPSVPISPHGNADRTDSPLIAERIGACYEWKPASICILLVVSTNNNTFVTIRKGKKTDCEVSVRSADIFPAEKQKNALPHPSVPLTDKEGRICSCERMLRQKPSHIPVMGYYCWTAWPAYSWQISYMASAKVFSGMATNWYLFFFCSMRRPLLVYTSMDTTV